MARHDVELDHMDQGGQPHEPIEGDIAGESAARPPLVALDVGGQEPRRRSTYTDIHDAGRREFASAAAWSPRSLAPTRTASKHPSIEFDLRDGFNGGLPPPALDTPATPHRGPRRRNRRRAASSSSHQTRATFRSLAEDALRAVRPRARRTSATDTSSQTSSTSTGSSMSWPDWRFWRNDGSESDHSSEKDSYVPPPDPEYTLLLPNLNRSNASTPMDPSAPHPYDRAPGEGPEDPKALPQQPRAFNLFSSQTIGSSLERLSDFLDQRKQLDGVEGDLSEGPGLEGGAAWWLDILCPSFSDMRALRKVRLSPGPSDVSPPHIPDALSDGISCFPFIP
jgi:hypothetical protein